ncbi:MAG: tryptophan synthase subunit alpha [Candidatus Gygaella obscura]|nr:tryptophan synthase subunit alpha [Candidatus Gygaella obscura]
MNRIENQFSDLKRKKKKAFIAFLTAGLPSLEKTYRLIIEFEKRGVDIIEIGVPFSDPLADGPIIQEASSFALKNKINLEKILSLVKKVRTKSQIPMLLMTYYNPVFCFPQERFIEEAKLAGVDGLIIPDLPPEEAVVISRKANNFDVDIVFFAAPTSSTSHLKLVSRASKGFIYYISVTGVTGVRNKLPLDLSKNIKRVKRLSKKPVCIGFGISSSKQVSDVSRFCDGVIVGSAIVSKIRDNINSHNMVKKVGKFVESLTCVLK